MPSTVPVWVVLAGASTEPGSIGTPSKPIWVDGAGVVVDGWVAAPVVPEALEEAVEEAVEFEELPPPQPARPAASATAAMRTVGGCTGAKGSEPGEESAKPHAEEPSGIPRSARLLGAPDGSDGPGCPRPRSGLAPCPGARPGSVRVSQPFPLGLRFGSPAVTSR